MAGDEDGFDPKAFTAELSHRPGVYRMQDADGRIIYVGKARDLKKRVASYFSGRAKDAKTMAMVERVAGIEVTLTNTESEALLLEHTLIKRHRPRFNILLRDDKSYPLIPSQFNFYLLCGLHFTTRKKFGKKKRNDSICHEKHLHMIFYHSIHESHSDDRFFQLFT